MDQFLDRISIAENTLNNDYFIVSIGFILCLLTSYLLKYIYQNHSTALTSKIQIGKIIPILSLSVFLIILVVKSSLALSLGLVGALSIVRFRTPIKEPEELVYLFLSIAIGLGYGSGQIILTSFVFSLILIIIYIFSKNNIKIDEKNFNLVIAWESIDSKNNYFKKINEIINENTTFNSLIKYDYESKNNGSMVFLIKISNLSNLEKIIEELNNLNSLLNISYFENQEIL